MNEVNLPVASNARDALIAELLGDVGRLQDEVRAIPNLLSLSMSDSIRIVADAVEDAERTAHSLQTSTKDLIQATSAKAGIDLGIELADAIHRSLQKVFEPALASAAGKIESLEAKVTAMSGQVRDAHATRWNYILLAGFVTLALAMIVSMGFVAVKAQSAQETNKWFWQEYQTQQSVISTLPPEIKKRFEQK